MGSSESKFSDIQIRYLNNFGLTNKEISQLSECPIDKNTTERESLIDSIFICNKTKYLLRINVIDEKINSNINKTVASVNLNPYHTDSYAVCLKNDSTPELKISFVCGKYEYNTFYHRPSIH